MQDKVRSLGSFMHKLSPMAFAQALIICSVAQYTGLAMNSHTLLKKFTPKAIYLIYRCMLVLYIFPSRGLL